MNRTLCLLLPLLVGCNAPDPYYAPPVSYSYGDPMLYGTGVWGPSVVERREVIVEPRATPAPTPTPAPTAPQAVAPAPPAASADRQRGGVDAAPQAAAPSRQRGGP